MGKHLAMFCGVIDFEHNRFTYSVAAHYPPPILINNDQVMSLGGRGLPLGLFKEVHHEEHTMDLEPHFTFIATSDGVLDVLPKGSALEKERRLQTIAMNVKNVNDLVKELNLSEDDPLPDDVALLVINRV
jgi:serine phosphatase RsbU (regulator of sigma subunit)